MVDLASCLFLAQANVSLLPSVMMGFRPQVTHGQKHPPLAHGSFDLITAEPLVLKHSIYLVTV